MKQLRLHTECDPFTGYDVINNTGSILSAIIRACAKLNNTSVPITVDVVDLEKKPVEPDSGAVLYIIVVLIFYSTGIVTLIVKHLKREKRELEEEKTLEDFFRTMPAYKKESEMKNVNRVAIHAFHALTSFSYDDDYDEEDDDDDECIPANEGVTELKGCVDTIEEVDPGENDTLSCIVFDLEDRKTEDENLIHAPLTYSEERTDPLD